VEKCGLDAFGLGFYEHGNENSGFINGVEFLD
jgi:hypothetical protein